MLYQARIRCSIGLYQAQGGSGMLLICCSFGRGCRLHFFVCSTRPGPRVRQQGLQTRCLPGDISRASRALRALFFHNVMGRCRPGRRRPPPRQLGPHEDPQPVQHELGVLGIVDTLL